MRLRPYFVRINNKIKNERNAFADAAANLLSQPFATFIFGIGIGVILAAIAARASLGHGL